MKAQNQQAKPKKTDAERRKTRHERIFDGQRLKDERDAQGLTQEDLRKAIRMGKSVQLSRWESGVSDPNLYWLARMSTFFNRPPSYFMKMGERFLTEETQWGNLSARERRLIEHVRSGAVLNAIEVILDNARQLLKDDPTLAALFREKKEE